MQTKEHAKDYSNAELMAVVGAKEIRNGEWVFIGIGIPMISGFLAIHTHAPCATLIFEGGYVGSRPPYVCTDVGDSALGFKAPYITSLWRTFSDLQRGYCDLAVIGCAQIDKYGNVNSTAIFQNCTYQKPAVRLNGSGGANDMISSARRTVIMARLEKRRFVQNVDYITSPGFIGDPKAREEAGLKGGGPVSVITDKAVFKFDKNTKEMYLSAVHPNVNVGDVKSDICWDIKMAPEIAAVEPPTIEEVAFIRGYDQTDVILRRRRLFENITFPSWVRLNKKR